VVAAGVVGGAVVCAGAVSVCNGVDGSNVVGGTVSAKLLWELLLKSPELSLAAAQPLSLLQTSVQLQST